jgi:nitrate reductase NapE component
MKKGDEEEQGKKKETKIRFCFISFNIVPILGSI